MRTIATDDPAARYVGLSVCHAAAPCNTAERIEVLFEVETLGPKERCVRWGPVLIRLLGGDVKWDMLPVVLHINTTVPD